MGKSYRPAICSLLALLAAAVTTLPIEFMQHLHDLQPVDSTAACLAELLKIIDHVKNQNFTEEVVSVISNSGKMFNDVGYYQSCLEAGNLSYYLIRPIRQDLRDKVNYGICVPKECDLTATNLLIAQDVINKHYLQHLANGTDYLPLDFTTHATMVTTDHKVDSQGHLFCWVCGAIGLLSLLLPIAAVFKATRKDRADKADVYHRPEEEASKSDAFLQERSQGLLRDMIDSFDVTSTARHVYRGRRIEAHSLNFLKFSAGFLILYSNEYLARLKIGINNDDKDGVERAKGSVGLNLAYFAFIAYDVLFLVSGAVNAMSLLQAIRHLKQQTPNSGVGFYCWFFFTAVIRRVLRLAPLMCAAIIFYYKVVPGLLSGPFEYLWSTSIAENCPATVHWAFSFIGNIEKGTQFCMSGLWYLHTDLQLFLLLPIAVILADLSTFVASLFTITAVCTSFIGSVAIFAIDDLALITPYSSADSFEQFMDYYQAKPWGKIAFYLIGAFVGISIVNARLPQTASAEATKTKDFIQSVVTKDIENEVQARFGQMKEDLAEKNELQPSRGHPLQVHGVQDEAAEEDEGVTKEELVDCTKTSVVVLFCLSTVVGFFVWFLLFARSKNSWSSVVQVVIAISSRVCIALAVAAVVYRLEVRGDKKLSDGWTFMGFFSNFSLSLYLLHLIYIDWGVASAYINQYFEPLLVFCYSMADLFVSLLPAILVTFFLEMPFRRLIRF